MLAPVGGVPSARHLPGSGPFIDAASAASSAPDLDKTLETTLETARFAPLLNSSRLHAPASLAIAAGLVSYCSRSLS